MSPRWRERIIVAGLCLLAMWLSYEAAESNWSWPLLAGGVALGAIVFTLLRLPLDVVALGLLLIGYIVGNRGFAQLALLPGLPILPGEIGLAATGAWLAVRCAFTKTLPWRNTMLNYAVLAFIVVGTTRFIFDLPRFGILAVRDFATVYYAGFFLAAQHMCRDPAQRRFLLSCLLAASASLPIVYLLFELMPEFFLGTLTIRGTPLVYFKGDLAPTFMGTGAILLYLTTEGGHRWWARPLATLMILWVLGGENRASAVGTLVAMGWLLLSRYRRFPALQGMVAVVALMGVMAFAGLLDNEWAKSRVRGIADRVESIFDLSGRQSYRADEGLSKSDNNQFRWVWWQTVASETMAQNPSFGLGFGYDLARGFLQEYNPDLTEEFSVRSPHNIAMTVFGRMGMAGLVTFLGIVGCLAAGTWKVIRDRESTPTTVALWVVLWPILVSACLGVVLEGPMGAVVFWTLLGIAHSTAEDHPGPTTTGGTESASGPDVESMPDAARVPAEAR